jgi:hypothetical protein
MCYFHIFAMIADFFVPVNKKIFFIFNLTNEINYVKFTINEMNDKGGES